MLGPRRDAAIMISQALIQISRHANVKTTLGILNNVDPRHAATEEVVAGAGFEPATFRL